MKLICYFGLHKWQIFISYYLRQRKDFVRKCTKCGKEERVSYDMATGETISEDNNKKCIHPARIVCILSFLKYINKKVLFAEIFILAFFVYLLATGKISNGGFFILLGANLIIFKVVVLRVQN